MAFDAALMCALSDELSDKLADGRIERIFQCTRDSFLFEIVSRGEKRRLLLSAGPSGGYLYLTASNQPHPDVPPMFCMLLRKHLSGGRIKSVRQCGFERVLELGVEFADAFGALRMRYLYLEALGRNSNLILCDENCVILGALRPVDLASSPDRPLITGVRYAPPRIRENAVPLTELTKSGFSAAMRALPPDTPILRALLDLIASLGTSAAKELCFRVCGGEEPAISDIDLSTLQDAVFETKDRALSGNFTFCAVLSGDGPAKKVVDFSCFDLKRFPGLEKRRFESPSALLDFVFGARRESARLLSLSESSRGVLCAAIKRLKRKLSAQSADLEAAGRLEEYKLCGDLLMQNLHTIRAGSESAELYDYEGNPISIALDPHLSVSHNAQRYYDRYKKAKRALSMIGSQIDATREELEYAQSVLADLDATKDPEDLSEIAKEVSAWDYGRRFAKKNKKSPPSKKGARDAVPNFARRQSPGGFAVLVGKNNLQNEYLTFRAASKNDLWFHIKDQPGPHVILHIEGALMPNDEDIAFAARCALNAKQRLDGAQVDYTRAKLVKHHPSGLAGRVVYTGEKSIFVRENS